MKASASPRCITCGLDVSDPPVLNRLRDGRVCPTCVERVLESLPPALPGREGALAPEEEGADEYGEGDSLAGPESLWRARYLEGGAPDEDQPA